MSQTSKFKAITPAMWAAAGAAYVVATACLWFFVNMSRSDFSAWPVPAQVAFSAGLPLLLAAWVLLVTYVYRDAKIRGMRYVMWTLLVIFVPNAIGFILYFILRSPVRRACPNCGTQVDAAFGFCPSCGTGISPACPQCRRSVEPGWLHCAHCGATVAPHTNS